MRYLFYIFVGATLFFSLSAGNITPAIVVNNDKFAHVIVFFVLSLFMSIAFPTQSIKNLIVVMILLAVGIEFAQYIFANRELSVLDLGASMVGIIGYMIMLKFIGRKYDIAGKVFKFFNG